MNIQNGLRFSLKTAFAIGLPVVLYLPLKNFHTYCANTESLSFDFLCLKTIKIISPDLLKKASKIIELKEHLQKRIYNLMKVIFSNSLPENKFAALESQVQNLPEINHHIYRMSLRCMPQDLRNSFASILTEEIIFRFVLQKYILVYLSQCLPSHLQPYFRHTSTRILLTTFCSCFLYTSQAVHGVGTHFLNGLILGGLSENYGLFFSILYHTGYNLSALIEKDYLCTLSYNLYKNIIDNLSSAH